MMKVECAYANKKNQFLISLSIHDNATIEDVIRASGVLIEYPELVMEKLTAGIFGQQKKMSDYVQQGDRVEIYRPLLIDPMEARRRRAPAPKRRKF